MMRGFDFARAKYLMVSLLSAVLLVSEIPIASEGLCYRLLRHIKCTSCLSHVSVGRLYFRKQITLEKKKLGIQNSVIKHVEALTTSIKTAVS